MSAVCVLANRPGHALPTVLYRGGPLSGRAMGQLVERAKEMGGKAVITVDGAKMLNLAHYESTISGRSIEEVGGRALVVTTREEVTPEILHAAKTLADSPRFARMARISWPHFFAHLEGYRLRGGRVLSLGNEDSEAKTRISRFVREARARHREHAA